MRLLIVDDHEVLRRGIRSLLANHNRWEVCGEAVDGQDAVDKARELKPDLIIMDVSMPRLNGLEATPIIRSIVPDCEVLILSQHESPQMIQQALKAGARGYVVKSSVARDLLVALEAVIRHEPCIEQKPSADAIALHACPSFVFALHLVPFTTSPEGSEKVSFPGLLARRIQSLRLLSVELSRPTIPDCHGLLRPPCSETKWATSPFARRFPSPLRASFRKEHSGRYAHFGLPIGH